MLAKANQALATLDKYRTRLDQVSTRLTALEFEGGVTLHDVLTVLQRAELVTRMAVEIERYIVELGTEGRLIEMQLEETMVGVAADKVGARARLPRRAVRRELRPRCSTRLPGCRTRTCSTSAGSPSCWATTASSTRSTIPVSPRGYRILGRIPRLPKLVVQTIVRRVRRPGRDPRRRATPSWRPSRASATAREGHPRGPSPPAGDQPRGPLSANLNAMPARRTVP